MHRQQARGRVGRSARIPMQIKKRNNPCAYALQYALTYARSNAYRRGGGCGMAVRDRLSGLPVIDVG